MIAAAGVLLAAATAPAPQPEFFGVNRGNLILALLAATFTLIGYLGRRLFIKIDSNRQLLADTAKAVTGLEAQRLVDTAARATTDRKVDQIATDLQVIRSQLSATSQRLDSHITEATGNLADLRARLDRPHPG